MVLGKKGGEKVMSLWWFATLGLVLVTFISLVLVFFVNPADIREKEADYLSDVLVDCFIGHGGILREEVFEESFDVFEKCALSKKNIVDEEGFYFRTSFKGFAGLLREDIFNGTLSYEKDCDITGGGVKAESFPRCISKKIYFIYEDGGKYERGFLELLTASNNQGGLDKDE
jgi:hypothetical protein